MMKRRTMFYLVTWSGLLAVNLCCSKPEVPQPAAEAIADHQGISETEPERSAAWKQVDASVREHGKIVGYGDLTDGLAELEKDFTVTIDDSGDHWSVSLFPHSGAGHDFMFDVMKDTGEMAEVIVGSLFPLPPPE